MLLKCKIAVHRDGSHGMESTRRCLHDVFNEILVYDDVAGVQGFISTCSFKPSHVLVLSRVHVIILHEIVMYL